MPIARSTAALCAADHDLARRIVVGDAADLAWSPSARRPLGDLLRRRRARRRAAPPSRPRPPAPPSASPGRAASAAARRRRGRARRPPPAPSIRPANGRRRRPALSASASPPSRSSTRSTARLTAISAGWAFSVRVRSRSGPSNISRESFCSSASSTSSKTSRAAAKASASSRPMPTAWEPWPGKTKARVMCVTVPR